MMWAMKLKINLFVNFFDKNINCLMKRHVTKTISTVFDRSRFRCNPKYRYVFINSVKDRPRKNEKIDYYIEHENLLAHEVMENNKAFAESVVVHPLKTIKGDQPEPQGPVREVFEKFYLATLHNLKKQRTLADSQFTNMISNLSQSLSVCSFNEIRLVLFCLCLWPSCYKSYTPNYKLLWNTLDKKCTHQLKEWNATQQLLIADYWFHLRLSRISIYNTDMIKNLISTHDQLTDNQFTQLMFCVALQRIFPQQFLDRLSKRLETVVDTVSMEELSVICLGFFKTENKINNHNVLKTILRRTTADIDNLDPTMIIRISKCLRKSFQPHFTQYYVPLIKGFAANMERWDLLSAVHSSLLCTTTYIFEPSLLDAVVEKMKNVIPDSRLKDICKIVQCLSQFNYMPHSDFHAILFDEIMKPYRLEEARKFPHDLLQLLLFYAYMKQYPSTVWEYALSSDFVEHCREICSDEILKNFAVLDYCIEIECSEYSGPRLKPQFLKVLQNHRGNLPDGSNAQSNGVVSKLVRKIERNLGQLVTPDNFAVRHVLPHIFSPVILVRLSSKNAVPLQQIVDACPRENILYPCPDESWGCFVICGPFSFSFKSNRLCGLISMYVRQLRTLGYKVALIPYQDFPFYEEQQVPYLKQKLDSLHINAEHSTSDTNPPYYEGGKISL